MRGPRRGLGGSEGWFGDLHVRRVYGTSGDRILLWFDLMNPTGGRPAPMGSEATPVGAPHFRARAVGAFEQRPGCPDATVRRMSPERLARLCLNECYRPSDVRKRIDRIEVVRIRPQRDPGEDVDSLIEDPWRTLVQERAWSSPIFVWPAP